MAALMVEQAYSVMENPTKRPATQGKSPCHRDVKRKQRIQDAHTHIIGTKGVGIHTITGIGVSTYAICHRDTNLVEKENIKAHPLLPTETGTKGNLIIVIPGTYRFFVRLKCFVGGCLHKATHGIWHAMTTRRR